MKYTYRIAILLFIITSNFSYGQKNHEIKLEKANKATFHLTPDEGENYRGVNSIKKLRFSPTQKNEGSFVNLSANGFFKSYDTGKPDLPVLSKLIEVPVGATIDVKIISYEEEIVDLGNMGIKSKICPAQPSVSKFDNGDRIQFKIDSGIYNSNKYFSKKLIKVEDRGIMRYRRIANLQISPFQYNPVENKLKVINNIEFEISFEGKNSRMAQKLEKNYKNPYFSGFAKDMIVSGSSSKELIDDEPVTYVIVSDPMFKEQLQPFVQWKKLKGFNVVEAYTDVIGTTKEDIKAYLKDLYENPPVTPPSFVLFVGDVEQIPAWDGTSADHITDLYYCEYTEDDLPEVYYGRFSAQTTEQLQPQIDKTLEYEKYEMPDPSYLNNQVLVAGEDSDFAPTHGNGAINYATDYYANADNGIQALTYLYEDEANSTVVASSSSYASDSIFDNINNGVGFANYTAHCNYTGWADPSFKLDDVANLTNKNKYGVWIGNCCLSVKFDVDESFGEAALRAENSGAVGDIGGSNNTYWDEDYFWGVGYTSSIELHPTYEGTGLGAYDRMYHQNGESIGNWYITQGQIPFAGNLAVEASTSSRKTYYWEIYHLMGDPSLMPYLGEPSGLTVSTSPSSLVIGMSEMTVTTEPYAYVALSFNGELLDAAMANASGEAKLTFDPINEVGQADLVITAQNRQPYMVQIEVVTADEPYVILDSLSNKEITGDADQSVDYGEELSVDVWLSNVSRSDDAFNVFDSLSTNDPYLTLIDSLEEVGKIDSNSRVSLPSAFSYRVSDSVPDQHRAELTMHLTGEDSLGESYYWTSDFNIILNAPVLTVEKMMVSDTGGNGDGILDAGESGLLSFVVKNTGHDSIGNVYGKLSLPAASGNLTLDTDSSGVVSIREGEEDTLVFAVSADESTPLETPESVKLSVYGADNQQYKATEVKDVIIGEIPQFYIDEEGTVETCTGYFYDSGGEADAYQDNENYTMTIKPYIEGNMVRVSFTSFDVEENSDGGCYDYLNVYDGTSVNDDEIGSYCNENPPADIMATNREGALTFNFSSDGYVASDGWVAEVSCVEVDSLIFTVTEGTDSLEGAKVKVGETLKTTDKDGMAVFLKETGTYDYSIEKTGYEKVEGEVTIDGTTKEDIVLQLSKYDLTFNVFEEDGSTPMDAEISFKGETVTTSNGSYTFTGLTYEKDVPYTVAPVDESYLTLDGEVDIISTKVLDIIMEIEKYEFIVNVIDEHNKVLQYARVVMGDLEEITDEEGKASFLLPAGDYLCHVTKEGYTSPTQPVILNKADSSTVKLLKIYEVTFNVKDSITSENIASAMITVDTLEMETGAGGSAGAGLSYGEHAYTVRSDGYEDFSSTVFVESKTTAEVKMKSASTGIADIYKSDIKVFPIPANSRLNVQFPQSVAEVVIRIKDITGKIVLERQGSHLKNYQINLYGHTPGVYILKILADGKVYNKRILIN